MGRVNWASVLAVLFVVLSLLAYLLAPGSLALVLAVLAVVWAILAHLR